MLALAGLVTISAATIGADPLAGSPEASILAVPSSSPDVLASPAGSPMASPTIPTVLITCGGDAYPGLGVDAPTGARGLTTPEGKALRRALRAFADDFAGTRGWRLAGRTEDEVLFLGQHPDTDPPQWAYIVLERTEDGWEPHGWGGCEPRIVVAKDVGSADWWLDPAVPAPAPDAIQLEVLVLELACASGSSAEGRIAEPIIVTTPTTVVITIGVRRRLDGDQDCQGNPPTPFSVVLPEPLGARQLLDGGHAPPRPPAPPEGFGSE